MNDRDKPLTVGDLLSELGRLRDETPVTAGVRVGGEVLPVGRIELAATKTPMLTIVPDDRHQGAMESAGIDDDPRTRDPRTIDSDLSRIAECVLRGESVTFHVRFTAELMEKCGARDPQARLRVLANYFHDAAEKVEEIIRFGDEAGEIAEAEGEDES